MAAILTNPPAGEPVSLAEAKAHLRITHNEEDALLGALIAAARRVAEARTGLCFLAQDWTLFRDDWPEDGVIEIPLAPVMGVEELAVHGEDDAAAVIEAAHYVVDLASRPARLMLRGSRQWQRPGRRINGIAVKVQAGFGAEAGTLPQPLRQAVLLIAAHLYAHRGEEQVPGWPASAEALLALFREARL